MAGNLPAIRTLPGTYLNASHSHQASRTMAPSKPTTPSPAASARSIAEKSAFGVSWPNCREPGADLLRRPSPDGHFARFANVAGFGNGQQSKPWGDGMKKLGLLAAMAVLVPIGSAMAWDNRG